VLEAFARVEPAPASFSSAGGDFTAFKADVTRLALLAVSSSAENRYRDRRLPPSYRPRSLRLRERKLLPRSEAMAFACPSVSTGCRWRYPQAIADGESGLLSPVGHPVASPPPRRCSSPIPSAAPALVLLPKSAPGKILRDPDRRTLLEFLP